MLATTEISAAQVRLRAKFFITVVAANTQSDVSTLVSKDVNSMRLVRKTSRFSLGRLYVKRTN